MAAAGGRVTHHASNSRLYTISGTAELLISGMIKRTEGLLGFPVSRGGLWNPSFVFN